MHLGMQCVSQFVKCVWQVNHNNTGKLSIVHHHGVTTTFRLIWHPGIWYERNSSMAQYIGDMGIFRRLITKRLLYLALKMNVHIQRFWGIIFLYCICLVFSYVICECIVWKSFIL